MHQHDFQKIIIDTLGLPSSSGFHELAVHTDNPAVGLISRRLFEFLLNSDKVIVEFRLPFQVKVLGIITHRLENLRAMFTSTDGITIVGVDFLHGQSLSILKEFLYQRFKSDHVNFAQDLRCKFGCAASPTLIPMIAIERCLYEAKFTTSNTTPSSPDRFLRSYSPSDFCLVCCLLYASLCLNVIHVLPQPSAKKSFMIDGTRKRFSIDELRTLYNSQIESFQKDYVELLLIHSLPLVRLTAFQEFDSLSGKAPPSNSERRKRPRVIQNLDLKLFNEIYDISY